MRVALLSAGPSLPDTFNPDAQHDLRIGVNTAASLFYCDWWCCADAHRFETIDPIGLPALFTMAPERDKMLGYASGKILKHRVQAWDEVFAEVGADMGWQNWSAPSALILGLWLGATSIECYGVDMAGTADCIGEAMPGDRKEQRWADELDLWNKIVRWLKSRGVEVRRHGVQPC